MRLMHIISGKGAGGSKQVFIDYQLTLASLGYDIIACVRSHSYVQRRLQQLNIPMHLMHYSRFLLTTTMRKHLLRLHRTLAPAWLVVHNAKDAKLWRLLLPQAKILLIVHSDDLSGVDYANRIITVNPTLQRAITSKCSKTCYLVPNGLLQLPKAAIPSRTSSHTVFGYLGKFRKSKGIFLLIRALSKLPANLEWSIIIQGEGHLQWLAQSWAYMKGIHTRIEWRTWQATTQFYHDIDILLVPSLRETFGLVVLESLAHNRKILSTNTPGPAWILTSLGLTENICQTHWAALTQHVLTACIDKNTVATVTPEEVWKHFGELSFRQSLFAAFDQLNSH